MMGLYLCYCELHVANRTFLVHVLVEAEDSDKALEKIRPHGMGEGHGEGNFFHLQAKGCLGEFTPELAKKYMTPKNCVGGSVAT